MEIRNYFQKMNEIYEKLQDEESRKLFEARITYMFTQNQDLYMEDMFHIYDDWEMLTELEDKINEVHPKGIIIFGCGYGGKGTRRILSFWGHQTAYFCDTYKAGQIVDDIEVLSVDTVARDCREYLVITSSFQYGEEMHQSLIQKGFPETNILLPHNGILMASRGVQYRDVFPPRKDEVYIDAGAFDGETIFDFCKWTSGKYKKIIAFEPISEMCEKIEAAISDRKLEKIQLINGATWDRQEKIKFADAGASSSVDETGSVAVQGVPIDSAVKDEKVTFIKMDIEGSELKALKGARETILRNHPRLAICIYHKSMDIIEIPAYILSLMPEYKFYIRHYTSNMWETVLYAE